MKSVPKRTVVLVAQGMLNTSTQIPVDGIWGPKSAEAHAKADRGLQDSISRVANELGFMVDDFWAADQSADLEGWMTKNELRTLIANEIATQRYSKELTTELMLEVLDLEAESKSDKTGERVYNPRSVSSSGLYKGLYQLGRDAWADAAIWHRTNTGVSLGDYESNVFDPVISTMAALGYAQISVNKLRKAGYPVTTQTIYASHQQGFGGLVSLVRSPEAGFAKQVFKSQSPESKQVVRTAVAQIQTSKTRNDLNGGLL